MDQNLVTSLGFTQKSNQFSNMQNTLQHLEILLAEPWLQFEALDFCSVFE